MSTVFQPFGMKPAYHPSGLDRSVPFAGTNSYVIGTSGYSAPYSLTTGQSFFQYQPVGLNASGQLTIAATSAATSPMYGVFDGVEYTTAEGRRTLGKSISKASLDAANSIVFWIFQDPQLVYEAQINGSATAASIGQQYNFSGLTGYTTADGYTIGVGGAGFSTAALAAAAVGTGVQGQVRVVGLGREVAYPSGSTNQWGDAYTIVQVQIANNVFAAPKTSV
jgi:hypothetical protein